MLLLELQPAAAFLGAGQPVLQGVPDQGGAAQLGSSGDAGWC
jgi:hypothetical protein